MMRDLLEDVVAAVVVIAITAGLVWIAYILQV